MKIRIRCIKHDRIVNPAGESLHFIPNGEGWHALDEADLYCPQSSSSHQFVTEIISKLHYCEGCERSDVLLNDAGYCRSCVRAAHRAGNPHLVGE